MSEDFRELGEIVADLGGKPRIDRTRVTTSILHDSSYHIAMIACVFGTLDHVRKERVSNIDAAWLKLTQFVAGRPKLAKGLTTYADKRRTRQREYYSLMPRGYLGDTSHDRVVNYLVIAGALTRSSDGGLSRSDTNPYLDMIFKEIAEQKLFVAEREIMKTVQRIRPSQALLGGK